MADNARRAEESHLDYRVALRKDLILYVCLDHKTNIHTDWQH